MRFAVVAIGCTMLVSCISLRPPSNSTGIDLNWSHVLQGRFIYKSPEESFSAVFTWRSKGSNYELRLRDRLGLRRIHITGKDEQAKIETSSGQILEDVDVQTWLKEELGISVPILELPKCLTMDCSLVKSGKNHIYDEQNRIIEFEYDAWTVQASYDSRNTKNSNAVKEIQMSNGAIKLRMIFDS